MIPPAAKRPRSALTLIEMLTTVAALVIVLGLMVSLAGYVRNRSAESLTRDLMVKLERLMAQYQAEQYRPLRSALAAVPELAAPETRGNDELLRRRAERNSAEFVRILRLQAGPDVFRTLPVALYDQRVLRDAWGTPVAYFHSGSHSLDDSPPRSRSFFVSAGPDRRFTTNDNNLYSYEWAWDQ